MDFLKFVLALIGLMLLVQSVNASHYNNYQFQYDFGPGYFNYQYDYSYGFGPYNNIYPYYGPVYYNYGFAYNPYSYLRYDPYAFRAYSFSPSYNYGCAYYFCYS